jgi:uncharacterized protein (DUF433 family)
MPILIEREAPPLVMDDTGTVRIGATRVTLDSVIARFLAGATAEEIADDYDSVALPDVYATIAYYLRHRQEVDAYLAERTRLGDELQAAIENEPGYRQLRQRLMERAQQRG